jgi:hypothetical protein
MMPDRIVGSLVTPAGKVRPFVFDAANGTLTLDAFAPASNTQLLMLSGQAAVRQITQLSGAATVRLGEYRCPVCCVWFDVVRTPHAWARACCSRCASTSS